MDTPSSVIQAISKNDSFLAHAHLGPDADSIGSVLGFKLGLESIGKVVTIYCEDDIPAFASFLPQVDQFQTASIEDILKTAQAEVYVSLDSAKWGLITHHEPIPEMRIPLVNIDHHPDNQIKTDLAWLEPKSSSTAEMVFYLLNELKVDITADIATCLLFGILGDTGFFQNLNTNENSLRIASILKSKGADYTTSLVELTRSLPYYDLKAWGTLLNNLTISPDKTFVYATLSNQEITELGHSPSMSLFANSLISKVHGTDFGAALSEKNPGITKGAIRARHSSTDVSEIAHLLGGGGHPGAAGFKIDKPLKAAEQDFLNAIEKLKKQGKI